LVTIGGWGRFRLELERGPDADEKGKALPKWLDEKGDVQRLLAIADHFEKGQSTKRWRWGKLPGLG